MCKDCTQELGCAYSFYMKVKKIDKKWIERKMKIEMKEEENDYLIEEIFDDDFEEIIESQTQQTPSTNIEEINENQPAEETEDDQEILLEEEENIENSEESPKTIIKIITKKPQKIPNFHLTGNVKSIYKKAIQSPDKLTNNKRKIEIINDNPIKRSKFIDLSNSSVIGPQLIMSETKICNNNDLNSDNLDSIFSNDDSDTTIKEIGKSIPLVNRKTTPPQATHKITMNVAAVTIDPMNLNSLYSNLDKSEDSSILYQCTYCPKAFATEYHLGLHNLKVHICQHCLKGFAKPKELHEHIKIEHDSFTCTFCQKSLSSNSNLRAHVKKIHGILLPAGVSLINLKKAE